MANDGTVDVALDVTVDVLVIGAGVAGLSTALGLAPTRSVFVADAGPGSTALARGGIAAAFGDDDPNAHAADTITQAPARATRTRSAPSSTRDRTA